jgi:hypothetical protein
MAINQNYCNFLAVKIKELQITAAMITEDKVADCFV